MDGVYWFPGVHGNSIVQPLALTQHKPTTKGRDNTSVCLVPRRDTSHCWEEKSSGFEQLELAEVLVDPRHC